MSAIARQQEQMREAMQQTMGNLLPPGLEEMRRQNVAMMERAMNLFSPFYRPNGAESQGHVAAEPVSDPAAQSQIEALQREVEHLRHVLAVQSEAATRPAPPASSPGLARPRRKPDTTVD
jgi:polyhydroxyalkanoate synthesis regulator protein